jgi:hypothetical protein
VIRVRSTILALICAAALASSCSDGGEGGMCSHEPVGDGSPGSCRAARALLSCPSSAGFDCGCVTDVQSCPECPTIPRLSCRNVCDSSEYAVECGEPLNPDVGAVVVFDPPPRGCHLAAQSSGTRAAYCCPCD